MLLFMNDLWGRLFAETIIKLFMYFQINTYMLWMHLIQFNFK